MTPSRDNVERWSGLRLWVYRNRNGRAPTALILRSAEGGQYRDRLIYRGQIDVAPGTVASGSPQASLLAALVDAYGEKAVVEALASVLAAKRPGVPLGGPQGGSPNPLTAEL